MASTLKIVQDGSDVYNLNAYPCLLENFTSRAPEQRTEDIASSLEDGRELLFARWDNVEETIYVLLGGSDEDAVEAEVEKLEVILDKSRLFYKSQKDAYYLHYKPDGSTTEYRTKILRAYIVSSEQRAWEPSMKFSYGANQDKKYSQVQLIIARDFYWEGLTLTDISLSNQHGSGTGGITVYWADDATHDNWVTIAAAAVKGSIDTPIYLSMKNNDPNVIGIGEVYISRNARFTPTSFQHLHEAEDAHLYGATTIETTIPTYYSNGEHIQLIRATAASWYTFCEFQMTTALLGYASNRWFRVLGRFYTISDPMYIKMHTVVPYYVGGLTAVTSTPVYLNYASIYDLGMIRLPPYDLQGYAAGDVGIRFQAKEAVVNGGLSFTLDYIMLMPTEEPDGFTHLSHELFELAPDETLIHDGPKEVVVVEAAGAEHFAPFYMYGRPVRVTPGVSQRLYFQFHLDTWANLGLVTSNLTVKAKYKERRLRV